MSYFCPRRGITVQGKKMSTPPPPLLPLPPLVTSDTPPIVEIISDTPSTVIEQSPIKTSKHRRSRKNG